MIEVSHVYKKYGRKHVLRDVTFQAEKGQITCLIGMNGAGKSTLLRAIMGLTTIDSGRIHIGGQLPGASIYEKAAYVPDTLIAPTALTIGDNIRFMRDFYRCWNEGRAAELLAFFRLNPSDRVAALSKGNAAKLNMLLGLCLDTDYLLMDEPFSGIDMFSREQIASVFSNKLIENRGVILTTHEIGDIEHLIDQAVLLDQGEVRMAFQCEDMRVTEGKSVIDKMREVYRA